MLVAAALIALTAAVLLASLPAVARGDTIEPTLIGPAELSVGEFVVIIVCAVVVVTVGIYALVRIRRRRRHEASSEETPGSEDRRQ
jgi:heme/copper-type cytochrome/quinol oxidase subunit 2